MADLPAIFAHELAHVRSHDVLWNVGVAPDFDRALVPSACLADAQGPSGGLRVGLRRGFGEFRRRRDRILSDPGPGGRPCLRVASGGGHRHGQALEYQPPAQCPEEKVFHCRCAAGACSALAVPPCSPWRFSACCNSRWPRLRPQEPRDRATIQRSEQTKEQRRQRNFAGRILDSNGAGIAHATIAPRTRGYRAQAGKSRRIVKAIYTLPPLGPGVPTSSSRLPPPASSAVKFFACAIGLLSDITLQRAASIAGRVLGADGKPLARARWHWASIAISSATAGGYRHAISNAAGDFTIENIPPGVAVVYYPGALLAV